MLKLVAMDRVDSSRAYLHLSGIGPSRPTLALQQSAAIWRTPDVLPTSSRRQLWTQAEVTARRQRVHFLV